MKAKEYYEEIKEFVKHPHFTKLTSNGIDPDYKSIFEFAEAYHEAVTKANDADTSNDKCTLHVVSASLRPVKTPSSKGDWSFERSSGYAGYRCSRCHTWVYSNARRRCECDK